MDLIIQVFINGILIGGIYSIVAIGLNLIFGVMKIINFAQGSFLMLGMYSSYWIFNSIGLNPYVSFPLSALILFVIGLFIHKIAISKNINAPEHNQLLVTFGVMLIIENLAMVLWSPDFRSIKIESIQNTIQLGDIVINQPKLIAFIFTLILTTILYWFIQKSYVGKAIRATASDRVGATIVGINVNKINAITFGLGASLAGVAGALISTFLLISPTIGNIFILKAFVVVVLGGLGNLFGALIGGMIIGISESFGGVYLEGSLKELAIFLIFILILLIKPSGLFGRGTR